MRPTLQQAGRRYDLDWLRIFAFGMLILYHAGMLYVTWPWHVKSRFMGSAIEPLMLASNPWRLTLLFLISGVAARFLLDKLGPAAFARERLSRLLLPLAFGMLVIVPPQAYFEVVRSKGYAGDYPAFMARYLAMDQSFGIILPTWNHLWFVAYMLIYTLLAAGLVAALGGRRPALAPRGLALLLVPFGLFAFYRIALFPSFRETHALFDDVYGHAHYFTAFALGFLIAKSPATWAELSRLRWVFLAAALIGYPAFLWLRGQPLGFAATATVRELYAWAVIGGVLGFGRLWLDRDSRLRAYLTEAIFPYYILHQTLLVLLWAAVQAFEPGLAVEASIVLLGTLAGCALGFELIRRVPLLRPLFGLKRLTTDASTLIVPAAPAHLGQER